MLMEYTLCFILSENIYFISPSFLKGSFTVQNSGLKIVFFFFFFQNSIKITFCFLASSVCEEVRNFLCNCSPVFIVCNQSFFSRHIKYFLIIFGVQQLDHEMLRIFIILGISLTFDYVNVCCSSNAGTLKPLVLQNY